MMVQTLTPLVVISVLAMMFSTEMFCAYRRRLSLVKVQRQAAKYMNFFFLITYLVLPSVTTTVFGAINCVNIDPDNLMPGTPTFMASDLSIACTGPNKGRYWFGLAWAFAMIGVYPVGVLSTYYYTLWYNRLEIMEKDLTEEELEDLLMKEAILRAEYVEIHGHDEGFIMPGRMAPSAGIMKFITKEELGFLHQSYLGRRWYWEVIETGRRLLLTAVISVMGAGTGLQIVFGMFVAIVYIKLYSYFQPYVYVS
jgi:hypothetical protein